MRIWSKNAELLGYPIVNKCPCGKKVEPQSAPQSLWWDDKHERWMRKCASCLERFKVNA